MSGDRMSGQRGSGAPAARVAAANVCYLAVMLALAAYAAWPIYASAEYLAVVGASVLVGALAAALAGGVPGARATGAAGRVSRRGSASDSGRGAWLSAAVLVLGYFLIGLGLAMPGWVWGWVPTLAGVASAPVTAWQGLLTIDIPVGAYRNLLMPAAITFMGATFAAARLAWSPRRAPWAVLPLLLASLFGLLFGPYTPTASTIGTLLGRETTLGLAALLASLAWLAWRAASERAALLIRAPGGADGRFAKGSRARAAVTRGVAAAALVALAAGVAVLAAPAALDRPREVLRYGRGPDLVVMGAVSPLAQFRRFVDDAVYEETLFTVAAAAGAAVPGRVRVAVLTDYDGQFFTAGSAGRPTQFRRVPFRLPAPPGPRAQVRIGGGALPQVLPLWLPLAGSPVQMTFAGPDATRLRDGLFYDRASNSAVLTAAGGLAPGDTLVLEAVAIPPVDPASLNPPGGPPVWEAPPSLVEWLEANQIPATGAGVAQAAALLRARGYLSRAVDSPPGAAWVQALAADGYVFEPSPAGHSLARIGALFQELNTRQAAVGAGGGASLVAAAGDDEQFAVAVALIADRLGFPARIVIGAIISDDDGDVLTGSAVPGCVLGVCAGASISAWVEIQGDDGQWAVIDVRPQHTQPIVQLPDEARLPEYGTQVLPDQAEEVLPPEPQPGGSAPQAGSTPEVGEAVFDAAPWLRAAGVGLLVVLALLGPPGVVVLAKTIRRRGRATRGSPAARVAAGWQELLDGAADHRLPLPPRATRSEQAAALGWAGAGPLAAEADRATYSDHVLTDDDAASYWRGVADGREAIAGGQPAFARLRGSVSPNSLLRRAR